MTTVIRRFFVSAAALGLAAVSSSASADNPPSAYTGRAEVYRSSSFKHNQSLEKVSSPTAIRSLFRTDGSPSVASTRIWQTLEHGEKVECLSCIPLVAGLLYDNHPKTREIAAWWLRRRIFGVFGEGQVYSQVIDTLADASLPETKRASAANALGEFLTFSGREPLAKAIRGDSSALVRASAVKALERMNSDGPTEEIAFAMEDSDVSVRLAGVHAATRINVFTKVSAIAGLVGDEEPTVRRAAAAALGTMRVEEAVDSLIMLASRENEPDASVRKAALWSLGQIGDSLAVDVLNAAKSDPDHFVRDAARVALMRIGQ